VEAMLELREERRAEKGVAKTGGGHGPFIGGRREVGAEASWSASMPRLEGTGYRSQEGEGVGPIIGAPWRGWERGAAPMAWVAH
jgi:hypothetical protein